MDGIALQYVFRPLCYRMLPHVRQTPNTITVAGGSMLVLCRAFMKYGQTRRSGFLLAGVCFFLYCVCDNLDGIVARATKQTLHVWKVSGPFYRFYHWYLHGI